MNKLENGQMNANGGSNPAAGTPMSLEQVRQELEAAGIPTETELAFGDPAKEIIKWVEAKGCDLVAMSTHGHKALGDLFFGATASKVQHGLSVPVLMLRAK